MLLNLNFLYLGTFVFLFIKIAVVKSHAILWDPPGRGTLWRRGFDSPPDYNDNQGFCGGFAYQHEEQGGKCGICGDPWGEQPPREHEAGGKYGNGIIAGTYEPGQILDVAINVTANHRGYFVFKLCPNNDMKVDPGQECFDGYPLQIVPDMTNKYYIDSYVGDYFPHIQLPEGLQCDQCILQWTYITGNSWGDCGNGTGAVGCGDKQEYFRACSDITIKSSTKVTTTTEKNEETTTRTNEETTTVSNEETTTVSDITSEPQVCVPTGEYSNVEGMNEWCTINCLGENPGCPPTHCSCQSSELDSSTTTTNVQKSEDSPIKCFAAGLYANVNGMDEWCTFNCFHNPPFCPKSHCSCL